MMERRGAPAHGGHTRDRATRRSGLPAREDDGAAAPPRVIRFRTSLHNTVFDVMKARNWVETDSEEGWDFCWADTGWVHENFDHMHFGEQQRINHFRNHYELTRKDLLVKNLKRAKKSLEKEESPAEAAKYAFFPQTYCVPAEYGLFVEEFKRTQGVWIMKPIGRAQGKGIFLFNKLSQIAEWKKDSRWQKPGEPTADSYVAQRYLENPYLIGGKKFDLRLYALVVSYSPLKVYLYRSGFARFSNTRFSMKKEDIANNYIHLTNVAVQKTAENYNSKSGMKWSLRSLKLYLTSRHGSEAINDLFYDMQNLIVRSLQAVAPVIINDKHCFEIYGYDLLIDDNLKPWLIEVNASPSLSSDTPADYELKFGMLDDAFSIIDMEGRLNHQDHPEPQVGGFDLVWNNGPVAGNKTLPSMMGTHNDRLKNLRSLFAAGPR